MSAALQFVDLHAGATASAGWFAAPAGSCRHYEAEPDEFPEWPVIEPIRSLAFYRKHTQKLMRRYLYASMLVGRAPGILKEPLNRGYVSSRPVASFEDALIFVLDMEKCLDRLQPVERLLLAKVVLQEYSRSEAAVLLRIGDRQVETRLGQALDKLTQELLDARLLEFNPKGRH